MYRLRTIGLAGVLAMIVAACSSGPAASPSASSTPAATASESIAPTPSAPASQSEVALPSIELPNTAPELLALLPDKVGGIATVPQGETSQTGEDYISGGEAGANTEFVDFLNRVGAEPKDVSVATKIYADMANATEATVVVAFRVAGADSSKLLSEMQASMTQDEENVTWEAANVGGKSVQVTSSDATANGKMYIYVRNDIVFAILTSDDALAADALGQLP